MPAPSAPTDWYLAQLKPNGLGLALRNLARQGFETFAPMERRTERTGSRFRTSDRPVFPGYLFVAFDIGRTGWQRVNATQGVARLVSFGNRPAPVPAGLVEGLATRFGAGDADASTDLVEGTERSLVSGPFAGLVGRIDAIEPDRRVHLLIEVMGRQTRLKVDMADLGRSEG